MPKLTDKAFNSIAEKLSNLEYLNLYANAELSDAGLSKLALSGKIKMTITSLKLIKNFNSLIFVVANILPIRQSCLYVSISQT